MSITFDFYIRHFAGFLIQFGAGMFICLLSFTEGAFRCSYRRVTFGCIALAVASSAFFPLAIGVDGLSNTPYLSLVANMYMLAAIIVFVFLYFWALRVERIKKLIVLVIALFYAATQYLLVNLIATLFTNYEQNEVYSPLMLALFAATAAVLFPPSALLMRRVLREYLIEMETENIRREFVAVLLATFLYLAMLVIYASGPGGFLAAFWWWTVPPLLMAIAVLCVFYFTLFRESVRRKHDSEERKALEIREIQYESITREIESTKRIRHDIRHLLNHYSQLLERGDLEALKEGLSEMTAQVSRQENIDYCKDETVNSLLSFYTGLAADSEIECRVKADCADISVSQSDLAVLFGNMMENAINACERLESDRWISVEVGVIGGSMMIQVTNPCVEVYSSGRYDIDGSFLPTAAFLSGRAGGGTGLHSLEHTAKKYGGEALFRFDEQEKTFTSRVRLNLTPKASGKKA
ncbi:MAG: GHKL domain-containing protein [Clostridiales bacterium]|nr:GHKL domain-containing protein [Clostridiales bacterium]